VLRSALRTAADLELIERAPTRGVRLPPIPKTSVTVVRPQVGPDCAEPKSASGRQSVPIPGFLATVLDEHLQSIDRADNDALVFTAYRGGRLHAGN
jgi:hypothetical protein